jgi:hypothetical protein
LNIDVIYGLGAANNAAPAGFYTAVNYVVNYLDQLFTNNVTININISYGSILDPYTNTYSSVGSNDLGESFDNNENPQSYSAVRSALQAENAPGSSTLPATSPVSGTFYMGSAEAKALGLIGASSALDGSVGVSSSGPWDFTPNSTPTSNEYYLVGTLEHEITEAMGRVSYLPGEYGVADLYRYSAPGVRIDRPGGNGSTAYFSINNGTTNLGSWNNQISNGDLADWYPQGPAPGGNDAFNDYSSSGVINVMSASDITLMQALGWTTAPTPTISATSFTVAAQQPVAASSFFTISNPSGDSITQYSFEDTGGGSGHFTVAGTVEPNGQAFTVSASSLSSVQYVGGSAAGTDALVVAAYDATIGAWVTSASLGAVTLAPFPFANSNDLTEAVYIGYFGRAGDPAGESYWLNQLNAGSISATGMAASFSVQPEATALYSFLAHPSAATVPQIDSFIGAVYEDLFNRGVDSSGLAYWQNQLETNLGNPQTVGAFILNVVSGAQGADQTTISNKVTVADYFTQALNAGGISYTSSADSLAHGAIASVTSASSTVLAAEATINTWLATQSSAAEVELVGMSHTGTISALAYAWSA